MKENLTAKIEEVKRATEEHNAELISGIIAAFDLFNRPKVYREQTGEDIRAYYLLQAKQYSASEALIIYGFAMLARLALEDHNPGLRGLIAGGALDPRDALPDLIPYEETKKKSNRKQ